MLEKLQRPDKLNFADKQSFVNDREQEIKDRGLGEGAPSLNEIKMYIQSYIESVSVESEKPSSNSRKRNNQKQVLLLIVPLTIMQLKMKLTFYFVHPIKVVRQSKTLKENNAHQLNVRLRGVAMPKVTAKPQVFLFAPMEQRQHLWVWQTAT